MIRLEHAVRPVFVRLLMRELSHPGSHSPHVFREDAQGIRPLLDRPGQDRAVPAPSSGSGYGYPTSGRIRARYA